MAMKRAGMAVAITAAFAAPTALADVTISGAINMGIAYVNSDDGNTGPNGIGSSIDGNNRFQLTNNYSNITISSLEDLGNGLKLDFAWQVNTSGTTLEPITNRNSHIGLVSESWGGVWYGTNENIYERYLYSIDPLDGAAGIGGNLQMLGNPGWGDVFGDPGTNPSCRPGGHAQCETFYRRTPHTVWYDSPNFNGVTFGAAVMLNAYSDNYNETSPFMWQVGVKYVGTGLPLQVWAAYEQHDDFNGLGALHNKAGLGIPDFEESDDSAMQIGAAYTMGDVTIFGIYERLSYETNGMSAAGGGTVTEYERDAFAIGLKWQLASGYIGAQYIQALEADCDVLAGNLAGVSDSICDDSDAKMIGVGYYHTLSRQTQAYVMGTWIDNSEGSAYTLAGADAATGGVGFWDSDHIAITIGLKHSF